MMRSRSPFLWAILAGIALSGLAPPSRADFVVDFADGNAEIRIDVTTQTVSTFGGASTSGSTITYLSATKVRIVNLTIDPNAATDNNAHGFNVSASVSTSNSPGTPTVAQITTSGLGILNQTGVAGNSTLIMRTGSTGFTAPATNPVILTSTASASADAGNLANASLVFNSFLNTTNTFLDGSGNWDGQYGAPTITLGPIAPGASASNNSGAHWPLTSTPYALMQQGQYTLGNGDQFFDGSTGTAVLPTPVPSGLLLVLSGMPVLGLGAWLRRWRITVAV